MYVAAIIAAVWILFVCATPAYAYIDPGRGGMIVQLLLGGVAGVAVILRLYWHRLLKLVGLRKPDVDEER